MPPTLQRLARVVAAIWTIGVTAAAVRAQSSEVLVLTPGQTVLTGSISVTIAWCSYGTGTERFDIDSRVITANGVNVTGDFSSPQWNPTACGWSGPVGDEEFYTTTGTVAVDSLTGEVFLLADASNGWNYHFQGYEYYSPPPVRRSVRVIAQQGNVTPFASTSRAERFTVYNHGNTNSTVLLTVSGCSAGAIGSCTLDPSSAKISLSPGASQTATVSYTASASVGAFGTVQLVGTDSADTGITSSAQTRVTITAAPSVGVTLVGSAPGLSDLVPRGACITIALTASAASECGDLRLAHAVAPIITMGATRAPTLIYNSQHARPRPLVIANVRLDPGVGLPTTVTACILVSSVQRGCSSWAGSSWGTAGSTRRIVVPGDTGSWSNGAVDFTLEVTASNGPQGPYTTTGRLHVVNRSSSRYGAGWWVAGLEQLTVVSSTVLDWIGGDGSVRRYTKTGSVWKANQFAALDSIVQAGSGYQRLTAEHARIYFNSAGRHDSTVNSLRHVTKFEYGGSTDSLVKIRVPRPSGGFADFSFAYAGGKLDSIAAPGSRGTKLFNSATRVDSIRDPDGQRVRFEYGTGLKYYVVTKRKDRQGVATTFAFDTVNRVIAATRPLGNVLSIINAETQGRATPLDVDSAFTEVNGPRTDVVDASRFWPNGYGAPVRTRSALGEESTVRYSSSWPGLADSSRSPAGLSSRVSYNSRGLPDTVKVFNPNGTADTAITAYVWHGALNRPTSVRTRTAGANYLVDSIAYNSDSTMAWQQRGTGVSPTRVTYTYTNPERLPATVTLPGSQTVSFHYDSLGNLRKEVTPLGYVSLTFRDALGRPSTTYTPRDTGSVHTDSANVVASGVKTSIYYDQMSRDTSTVTRGPRVVLPNTRIVPVDTIRIRKTFDAEGRPLTHGRLYSRNSDTTSSALYAMNNSEWEYDSLGRVYRKKDAGSSGWTTFTYDPAGNVTNTATPRGYNISAKYDAQNRVTQRLVPQVTYASSECQFYSASPNYPNPYCYYTFPTLEGSSLCIAVDTSRFGYDAAGNLALATNNWAKVSREYAPNGALLGEVQKIRTYDTQSPGSCGGGDRHAISEAYDWWAHEYGINYSYDLAGRRTELKLPNQLDPLSTGRYVQRYKYNSTYGTLDTLVHSDTVGGDLTTRFVYDDQGRLVTTYHPGSVSTTIGYDADGRVVTRDAPLTNDALTYDAAGRVVGGTVEPPSGGSLTLKFAYNGLGAMQWAQGLTPDLTSEDVITDALGTKMRSRDVEMVDGVNRTRVNTVDVATGHLTGVGLGTGLCSDSLAAGYMYQSSCHPSWYWYDLGQEYDASGNVIQTWEHENSGTQYDVNWRLQEDRSYFAADEKLTYYNKMHGWIQYQGQGTGTFDEYRYDALGRRVLTRSRRIGTCDSPCDAFIERTVYDGDQVLAEIRSSGATGTSATYLEGEGSVAPGGTADLYGIVLYAHAQGIDAPSHILKKVPNATWKSVTPHADWRGVYAYGTLANGSTCTTVSAICPSWPGYQTSAYGELPGVGPTEYTVWVGSLVRGRRDASGLTYLRNRYYDSNTGRFTQMDQIGLAGGLNLYGFAGGDPVNFSDPFGLSRCPPACGEVFEQLAQLAPSLERELVTFVPKNAAGALTGMGIGAIAGKVAGAVGAYRGARAVAGVVEASGGSINRAIAQSNSAGLTQGQAVEAITTVIESTGRGIGGVVEIGAGAVAIAGRQPGIAQPIVIVGARGAAQMGSATTKFTVDVANRLVTNLSNIVPE